MPLHLIEKSLNSADSSSLRKAPSGRPAIVLAYCRELDVADQLRLLSNKRLTREANKQQELMFAVVNNK